MSAEHQEAWSDQGLTRRAALGRAGGALAALSLPALLLEACGGGSAATSATGGSTAAANGHYGTIGFFGFPGDDFSNSRTLKSWLSAHGAKIQTQAYPGPPVPSIIQLFRSGRNSGIDIVDAYTEMPAALNASGGVQTYLQPIDPTKIPNLSNMIPQLKGNNQPWVINGKMYTVPVSVSPNSPVWSSARVSTPIQKWSDLADPRFKGRLGFISFPEINYALAVAILGLNPGSNLAIMPKHALPEAISFLKKVRANARIVSPNNGDSINALNAGEIDVIWGGYPGLAVLANQAKPQTKATYNIFPAGGSVTTIQGWAVAAGASNADGAYAAINEALTPQVQADYNNFIIQGPVVTGVNGLLKPSLRRIYSASAVGAVLSRYQHVVDPPVQSSTYVTADEWTSAFATVTG